MGSTIKDIARRAGVSPATVSRILGGYGYASGETRRKVLKASRDLQYRPNSIAKSMVKGTTKSIGLVVADISDPFFITIIREVEQLARKRGYSLLVSNTNESPQLQLQALDTLIGRQVDGVILVPADRSDPLQLQQITTEHRVVCLDRYVDGVQTDFILFNNYEVTRKYARVFLSTLGKRQAAVVYPRQQISPIIQRLEGFSQAMEDQNIPEGQVVWLGCDYQTGHACERVGQFVDESACSQFFTLDSQMTLNTLRALYVRGLTGRERYHLLTFDDQNSTSEMLPYRITPIIQPAAQLARTALQKLIERIEQPGDTHTPVTITLSG